MESSRAGLPRTATFIVGFDGSQGARRALHYACGLIHRQGGDLVAVHAVTSIVTYDALPGFMLLTDEAEVAEIRQLASELASSQDVAARFVSLAGQPSDVILTVAESVRADAIVVGAPRPAAGWLSGRTPERALRRSRCPVIVVP
jgi:nucleotide-binding universal stress UspA family protein